MNITPKLFSLKEIPIQEATIEELKSCKRNCYFYLILIAFTLFSAIYLGYKKNSLFIPIFHVCVMSYFVFRATSTLKETVKRIKQFEATNENAARDASHP